jgi:hypothetical protein
MGGVGNGHKSAQGCLSLQLTFVALKQAVCSSQKLALASIAGCLILARSKAGLVAFVIVSKDVENTR